LVSGISEEKGLEHQLLNKRSIKAEEFKQFIEQLQAKHPEQKLAVFMDNLQVHKTAAMMQLYKDLDILPIFNVAYSPQFNGIETYFSLLKGKYKQLLLKRIIDGGDIDAVSLIKESVASVVDSATSIAQAQAEESLKRL
jgi:hypothetical protein